MGFPFMIGRKGIDLLPEAIQRQKRNRKLIYVLAAVQAAIFLCLVLGIVWLNALERQAWEESGQLQQDINILRQNPAIEIAAHSREMMLHLAAEEVFFEFNAPAEFDPLWLEAILYADMGHLTGLDYDGIRIQITGIVYYFGDIEAFRLRLMESGIFGEVGLGSIRSQGDERFGFDLRLVP